MARWPSGVWLPAHGLARRSVHLTSTSTAPRSRQTVRSWPVETPPGSSISGMWRTGNQLGKTSTPRSRESPRWASAPMGASWPAAMTWPHRPGGRRGFPRGRLETGLGQCRWHRTPLGRANGSLAGRTRHGFRHFPFIDGHQSRSTPPGHGDDRGGPNPGHQNLRSLRRHDSRADGWWRGDYDRLQS